MLCCFEWMWQDRQGVYWEYWVCTKRKEGRSGHIPTDGAVFSIPSLVTLALAILAGAVLYTQGTAHTLITCLPCPALFTAACATHTHTVSPTVHRAHLCRHIPGTCYISIFNNKIIWTTTKQSNFQLIIRWWYYQVSWCLQIKYQHHFPPQPELFKRQHPAKYLNNLMTYYHISHICDKVDHKL